MPALARFYPPVWQGKRNTSCCAPFPGLPGSSQPCSRRIFHTAALRLFYQGTRLRYTTPARVLRNSWRFWCGNWPGRRRPAGAVRRGHAPRREAGGGRRRATARFFRPVAAFSGPTPRAFGQPTRRTAGAAPEMGQRSDAKSVTLPPGPGRATWAESVAPFQPSCGGGGGGRPAPPERCAPSRSAWRRAVPERPGHHPRERPVLVVEDQIRGAVAGNRPSGPAPKAPVERCRDRRVGREPVRPDEFPGETIRGGRIVERRQFVRRRGVQPARAERGGDGREATGGQGPPKTNSPRHPGPQRGVPSGGWIRRTSSTTTRPTASGSSRPTNAGPLAVKAKKPAGEAAGRAWRRSR